MLNSYLTENIDDGSKVMRTISWVKKAMQSRQHSDSDRDKLKQKIGELQGRVSDTKELAEQTKSPAASKLAAQTQDDLARAMSNLERYDRTLDLGEGKRDRSAKKSEVKKEDPKVTLAKLEAKAKKTERDAVSLALKTRAAKSDVSVLEVKIDKETNSEKLENLKGDMHFDNARYEKLDKQWRDAKRIADAAQTELDSAKESAAAHHDPDAMKKNSAALIAQKKTFDEAKAKQETLVKEKLESDKKLKMAKASVEHAKKAGDEGLMKKTASLLEKAEKHHKMSHAEADKAAEEMEDAAMELQKLSKKQAVFVSKKFKLDIKTAVDDGKATRKKALLMRTATRLKRDDLQKAADKFGGEAAAADQVRGVQTR